MSGLQKRRLTAAYDRISDEVRDYNRLLDYGCRKELGISAEMYRALDRVFNIITLVVMVYLIEYTEVETIVAIGFAVLLIAGVEGLERLLIFSGDKHAAKQLASEEYPEAPSDETPPDGHDGDD